MIKIYVDGNSNMPPNKIVLARTIPLYLGRYGNPSSFHSMGLRAQEILEYSRIEIANTLNCLPEEIFFVSGASEAISWVSKMRTLIVSPSAHHSIKEATLNCSPHYSYRPIVALPLIDNETGQVNDIGSFDEVFLDLTSSIGKIKVDLGTLKNVKYACFSAHKFGGILGAGVLFIRKDVQKYNIPLIYGSQEFGMRGGTENFPAIYSMALALMNATKDIDKNNTKIEKGINYVVSHLNGVKIEYSSNVINITFKTLNAQSAVIILNSYNILCSAGSACLSGNDEPSEILIYRGYSKEEAYKTIRLSFDKPLSKIKLHLLVCGLNKIIDKYDK